MRGKKRERDCIIGVCLASKVTNIELSLSLRSTLCRHQLAHMTQCTPHFHFHECIVSVFFITGALCLIRVHCVSFLHYGSIVFDTSALCYPNDWVFWVCKIRDFTNVGGF